MKKQFLATIMGFAMAVLGLTILVDTALAAGSCCCCCGCGGSLGPCACQATIPNMNKACDATAQYTCEGQTNEGECLASTSVATNGSYLHEFWQIMQDFPSCYGSTPNRTKVDQPSMPCERRVRCSWSGSTCGPDPNTTGPWKTTPKYVTNPC